jgi:hypothetical protein
MVMNEEGFIIDSHRWNRTTDEVHWVMTDTHDRKTEGNHRRRCTFSWRGVVGSNRRGDDDSTEMFDLQIRQNVQCFIRVRGVAVIKGMAIGRLPMNRMFDWSSTATVELLFIVMELCMKPLGKHCFP